MSPKSVFYLFLLVVVVEFQTSFGQGAVNGTYWLADAGVPASDIDSTLFTHLFCAFANLDPQTNKVTLPSASFSQFTSTVRRKNPSVKTLLSIGGGNIADPNTFPAMASQPSSRKSFIDSSISVARANGFSGLDLDWEYPRTTKQMADLGSLLKEWRAAVAAEAASSGRSPLLLTAAFYYAPKINDLSYPVQAIQKNLDFVNAMAYDFYDPSYSKVTRPHSALYDPAGPFTGSYGIEGNFIHATIERNQVEQYSNKFKEGKIYGVKNFLCVSNYLQYKTSMLPFVIKFKKDTLVKEYKKLEFPNHTFRLKSFSSILMKHEVDEKVLIDIIGRVVEIYSPVERNFGGRMSRLIDFVLEDANENQIYCTVWDDHVDQLLPYFNSTSVEPVILLLQLCRVRLLDNGEVRISSSFNATKLWFNHKCPQFSAFVERRKP